MAAVAAAAPAADGEGEGNYNDEDGKDDEDDDDDGDDEDGSSPLFIEVDGGAMLSEADFGVGISSGSGHGLLVAGGPFDVARARADLEWHGPDRFSVTASADGDAASSLAAVMTSEAAQLRSLRFEVSGGGSGFGFDDVDDDVDDDEDDEEGEEEGQEEEEGGGGASPSSPPPSTGEGRKSASGGSGSGSSGSSKRNGNAATTSRVITVSGAAAAAADALRAAAGDIARAVLRAAGRREEEAGDENREEERSRAPGAKGDGDDDEESASSSFPLSEEELADYVRSSVADALTSASSLSAFSAAAAAAAAASSGSSFSSSSSSPSEGIAALGRAAAMATAAAPGLRGKVTYTRLPTGPPPLVPFEGLYMGCFGPDGPELLCLRRVEVSSGNLNSSSSSSLSPSSPKPRVKEEAVVAVRLASDGFGAEAGARLFSARIGKGQRSQGGGDIYPPELGVQARYPGKGYLDLKRSGVVAAGARRGGGGGGSFTSGAGNPFSPFSMRGSSASRPSGGAVSGDESDGHREPPDAAAVSGELLLFSGRSPVTRGATLGFCWGERGERRHLVLLSRVSLDDPSVRAKARVALSLGADK